MMDSEQALIFHKQEFTQVEIITLVRWLELARPVGVPLGIPVRPTLAGELLAAGLELEHYTSLLASDYTQRTPFQLAEQQRLLTILNGLLKKDDDDPPFILPTPDNLYPNASHPIFKDLHGFDR